jgi:hypothetical protein
MVRHAHRSVAALSLALAALALGACSSAPTSSGGGTSPTKEPTGGSGTSSGSASSSSGATPAAPATVTETGIIVNYSSKEPVEGATVTAGDQTVTTAADGSFSLTLESGESFALSVAGEGYASLLEQSTSLSADYSAGNITLVPATLARILTGYFTGYDDTLGVLSLDLVPLGSCSSIQGATVSVSPAGSAKVMYFTGGMPSPDLTSAQAGEFPSAAIYNVEPGVPLTVTVTGSSCSQAPFPVTQEGVEYTGGITTQPGQVTGFARVFLQ